MGDIAADFMADFVTPADRMRSLGDGRYELEAVIDADGHQGLGPLSHVDPRMTIGQVVGRIVQEALDRHDPSGPAEGDAAPATAADEEAVPEPPGSDGPRHPRRRCEDRSGTRTEPVHGGLATQGRALAVRLRIERGSRSAGERTPPRLRRWGCAVGECGSG